MPVALALVLVSPAAARGAQPGGYASQAGQHGPASSSGGPVQRDPRVVLVMWGWTGTPEEQTALQAEQGMVGRLSGSVYGAILGQYGVHDDSRLVGTVTDPQAPSGALTRAEIRAEVRRAERLSGWRNTFDTQWAVLPPAGADFSHFSGYCGWHAHFRANDRRYTYTATMPYYAQAFSGCAQGAPWADAMTAATSHEWAEAATDTDNGWVLPLQPYVVQEIADVCAGQYVRPWGLDGPTVQALWSNLSEGPNKDRGCVERVGGGVPRCVDGAQDGACANDSAKQGG